MSTVKPRFYTIFCDDVREEVRGKISLMGTYSGSIQFDRFPAEIRSLGLVFKLAYPLTERLEQVRFEVSNDADIDHSTEIPKEQLEHMQSTAEHDDRARVHLISAILMLSNLTFTSESVIRTRCVVNGEELDGDGLIVKLLPAS